MKNLSPFAFNAARFYVGSVVLIPILLFSNSFKSSFKSNPSDQDIQGKQFYSNHFLLKSSFICGFILFITATFQQIGIIYTTVGKAGFITSLYIVIVPVLGLFMGKHISMRIRICILSAMIGMYLLCMTGKFNIAYGDFLILLCALTTAIHILLIDHFSTKINEIKFSCLQFFFCATLSLLISIVFEETSFNALIAAIPPILYSGILSCGVAYTLQTLGQKHVPPTMTALILSLESVFSVLSGWLILHQTLSIKELIGCAIMFYAIVFSQLPNPKHINADT
ncbi:DMT family transporter [Aminipila sp.]|uniref:DMT family transporter n=1 Tax=Aminipila sp. TaxID=2060095 RepID=UPI0028A120B2|nr:DMT family transporter [Aminipila sp.]